MRLSGVRVTYFYPRIRNIDKLQDPTGTHALEHLQRRSIVRLFYILSYIFIFDTGYVSMVLLMYTLTTGLKLALVQQNFISLTKTLLNITFLIPQS